MKIGLFIVDDIFIKDQIIVFLNLVSSLGLDIRDFHIFIKQPRKNNRLTNEYRDIRFPAKYYIEKIQILIMRKMLTTKLASRWVRISNESTIHQIDSINSSTTVTLLSEQEIDIGFFINFDEIVKNDTLLKIKRTFNLHNGLLPNYRGCQPIVWQMLNNEKISLMTLHVMTTSIDDGDIVFECPFNINYKKGVFLNNVQSFKSIPSTLIFGLRKILYCTAPFTRQDQYKIQTQYFKRPSAQDTRKVYFKG